MSTWNEGGGGTNSKYTNSRKKDGTIHQKPNTKTTGAIRKANQ